MDNLYQRCKAAVLKAELRNPKLAPSQVVMLVAAIDPKAVAGARLDPKTGKAGFFIICSDVSSGFI